MSYQSGDFSDWGSTSIDDTQMPHQIKPASTTTKNTKEYLDEGSKLDKIVGNDNIEKVIEKKTKFKLELLLSSMKKIYPKAILIHQKKA